MVDDHAGGLCQRSAGPHADQACSSEDVQGVGAAVASMGALTIQASMQEACDTGIAAAAA